MLLDRDQTQPHSVPTPASEEQLPATVQPGTVTQPVGLLEHRFTHSLDAGPGEVGVAIRSTFKDCNNLVSELTNDCLVTLTNLHGHSGKSLLLDHDLIDGYCCTRTSSSTRFAQAAHYPNLANVYLSQNKLNAHSCLQAILLYEQPSLVPGTLYPIKELSTPTNYIDI